MWVANHNSKIMSWQSHAAFFCHIMPVEQLNKCNRYASTVKEFYFSIFEANRLPLDAECISTGITKRRKKTENWNKKGRIKTLEAYYAVYLLQRPWVVKMPRGKALCFVGMENFAGCRTRDIKYGICWDVCAWCMVHGIFSVLVEIANRLTT